MTEFVKKLTKQDIRNTLSIAMLIGSYAVIFRLMNHAIPAGNRDAIILVLGIVIGKWTDVMNFFFQSAKSEIDRTKRLHDDTEDHG